MDASSANLSVDEANLRVTGDLDLATTGHVRPSVLHHIETTDAPEVVLDLTGLRYLSSCGIALLLDAAALAGSRGVGMTVRVVSDSAPLRILQIAGLTGRATRSFAVDEVPASYDSASWVRHR